MSASSLRYRLRDDGNGRLRERLTELAGQHCGHGYRMLHSRLRIDSWTINVKLGLADRRLDATSDGFRLICDCRAGPPLVKRRSNWRR